MTELLPTGIVACKSLGQLPNRPKFVSDTELSII